MNALRYLRSRLLDLLIFGLTFALLMLMLWLTGASEDFVALVSAILLVAEVLRLFAGYLPLASFWHQMDRIAQAQVGGDPTPIDVASTLPSQRRYPANCADDAVDALLDQYRLSTGKERADAAEYRSYIERWSHEVKTPVAAISLMVQGDASPLARRIEPELQRIESCVDQALYLARSYSVDRDYLVRPQNLGQLVREVARSRMTALQLNHVHLAFEGLDQQIYCDPKWVTFILGQLVDNAIKYASPERELTLAFIAHRENQSSAHETVVLEVRDNGQGIPLQDLPRIWDKGFVGENGRDRSGRTSTGIGLFLVQDLARKMGLSVDAWSDGATATTISITFPMVANASNDQAAQ